MIGQTKNKKSESKEIKSVTLDLSEVIDKEAMEKLMNTKYLQINGRTFMTVDHAKTLMVEFGEKEGYATAKRDLVSLSEKHEALKSSFNKVYNEYKELIKETDQYKKLNRNFLQKVKSKIKK